MVNDRLNLWFGLSHASFLVVPRVLMQEMPTGWQEKMAELLEEYEDKCDTSNLEIKGTRVMAVGEDNKLIKMPSDILNYRRPSRKFISSVMVGAVAFNFDNL